MPEGKKAAVPAPKPVREEDLYSAKTHLHQPVPVQETATVSATAQLADAPEGALPSEVRPEIVTWEKLCEAIKASGRSYNMEMIEKAYDLANTAHKGVCRRSGEPYICHPLAVARLVLDLGMDSESIAAALLHDVVEDTPTTLDDLKAAFGEEVALLVDGVTKLTKIQFSNIEELQAENLRKMLLAMSRDVRVMIIKLCDRLHNMRTGDAWPEQKRRDKARETMEVYAPIANRLGILNVKEELEDRSLHYLDPVGYEEISRMLSERAGEEFLAKVSGVIERRLAESGIEGATIKRRVKSIYGIYRKTIMQNKSFDEIYDIYAVRVILDTLAECYSTLGLIHDMYHPLPNRFKDYISTPKPNGYQSLHTTVIGHEGIPFEVQIRTTEMHEIAEYGVAAHWKYKQNGQGAGTEGKYEWVRRLLENQEGADAEEFIHSLKVDMFSDEVFVFTPNGDVQNLPAGATPIDFAYAIHSAVGNRMIGAKVNNRIVTLDGQVINAGGSFTGGSTARSVGVFSRKQELDELRSKLTKLEQKRTEAEKELAARKAEVDNLSAQLAGAEGEGMNAATEHVRANLELERLTKTAAQYDETARSIEAEIAAQQAAVTRNETARTEAEKARTDAEAELAQYTAELAALGESTGSLTAEREKITGELSEKQLQRLADEKDVSLHEAALDGLRSRTGEADARARELQTAIEAAKAKIEANALKIAEMERVRGDNQQKIAAAEETIRSANAARLEKEAAISKLGQDNRALTDERERMSGEMARLAERRTAAETELNDTNSKLWEEYQLTESEARSQCVPFESLTELRRSVTEVRGKIRALGNVNVGAIDEYKEVRERYDFLKAQSDRVSKGKVRADEDDRRAVQRDAGAVHGEL